MQQTSIYIPKPCHEDWNKMTPTQQGKFCGTCSKQVIDFSLMSDNQILNFLSQQSGKLCGRFDPDQLQRPLIETRIKKKKSWWMALTMPLLFLFDRSEAQKNMPMQKHSASKVVHKQNILVGDVEATIVADALQPSVESGLNEQLVGKVSICEPKQITIKGTVIDEDNKPLAYASVIQKGTIHGTTTDSMGNFSIEINTYEDSATLTASYIGFSSTDMRIELSDTGVSNVIISLKEQSMGLSEVVVVGEALTGRAGGLSICYKISRAEKIDTSFKKLTGISNIYPNPAIRGSLIHIKMKNTGNYQMQLLDNQSHLIQTEEINIVSDKSTTSIQLPSNIASGVYYLRLINVLTKKQYTEKLLIL